MLSETIHSFQIGMENLKMGHNQVTWVSLCPLGNTTCIFEPLDHNHRSNPEQVAFGTQEVEIRQIPVQ
jgi:hypothetical protein